MAENGNHEQEHDHEQGHVQGHDARPEQELDPARDDEQDADHLAEADSGPPPVTEYRVELDVYSGPLDLLLYLIRREEVDIYDIPIARVTARYMEYVEFLKIIDPDSVGDFLVMAATLMEIKSRTMLPRPPEQEDEEDFGDPRMELIQRLLEYKKYKDAAGKLALEAQVQALKFPRHPALPPSDEKEVDLEYVQIWDLVAAFKSLLEQTGRGEQFHEVVFDDTPIALHAADVLDSLERAGGVQLFETIFTGRNKSELIGLFLALLELIRQRRIRVRQESSFGSISIQLLDATPIHIDEDEVYSYQDDEQEEGEAGDRHAAENLTADQSGGESLEPIDELDEMDTEVVDELAAAADESLSEVDDLLSETGTELADTMQHLGREVVPEEVDKIDPDALTAAADQDLEPADHDEDFREQPGRADRDRAEEGENLDEQDTVGRLEQERPSDITQGQRTDHLGPDDPLEQDQREDDT